MDPPFGGYNFVPTQLVLLGKQHHAPDGGSKLYPGDVVDGLQGEVSLVDGQRHKGSSHSSWIGCMLLMVVASSVMEMFLRDFCTDSILMAAVVCIFLAAMAVSSLTILVLDSCMLEMILLTVVR